MLVIIWSYIKIERRTTTTIISERVYRVIYNNEGEKKTKKENCYFFDNNDKKIQSGVRTELFVLESSYILYATTQQKKRDLHAALEVLRAELLAVTLYISHPDRTHTQRFNHT